jgi:hypothetical protein
MATKRGTAIRSRDHALRDSLFEDAEARLWDRSRFHGFATIPKTIPYVCRILDELSKGQPLASTYLALWCATWDDAFIKLGRMPDLAFAAGFSGQRGVRTFQDRVRRLADLGFVEVAPAGLNALGLAFLPNPHIQIMRLYAAKMSTTGDPVLKLKAAGMQAATYNAFIERAQEIDCTDIKTELKRQQRTIKAAKAHDVEDDDDQVPVASPAKRTFRIRPKPTPIAKGARALKPRPGTSKAR